MGKHIKECENHVDEKIVELANSRVSRDTRYLARIKVDHHLRLNTRIRPIEEVPRGKGEKNRGSGVKKNLKPYAYKQSELIIRVTACLLKNEPASY